MSGNPQAENPESGSLDGLGGLAQCQATRQDGQRCAARVHPDSDGRFCMWHDPDPRLMAVRREWQSKGGIARHGTYRTLPPADVRLRNTNDLLGYLEVLVEETQSGRLGLKLAAELRAMVGTAAQIIGTDAIEGRLEELDRRLSEAQAEPSLDR